MAKTEANATRPHLTFMSGLLTLREAHLSGRTGTARTASYGRRRQHGALGATRDERRRNDN
jgi:hypothetical protein